MMTAFAPMERGFLSHAPRFATTGLCHLATIERSATERCLPFGNEAE
jgi:hypothetical protein